MHIRTSLALGLCIPLPASSFADFRYDETTKITGGYHCQHDEVRWRFQQAGAPDDGPGQFHDSGKRESNGVHQSGLDGEN